MTKFILFGLCHAKRDDLSDTNDYDNGKHTSTALTVMKEMSCILDIDEIWKNIEDCNMDMAKELGASLWERDSNYSAQFKCKLAWVQITLD